MIVINYGETSFELKNEFNEFFLFEFQKITDILNNEDSVLYKYLDIFTYLGLGKLMDVITDEKLIDIIVDFRKSETPNVFTKEWVYDGITYTSYVGEEYKLMARDMGKIEKAIIDNNNVLARIMSIIFKSDVKSEAERFIIFDKNMTADIAIPFIASISERSMKSLEKLIIK